MNLTRCLYTDGKEFNSDFVELCKGKKLTFDIRFLDPDFIPEWWETPFKQIRQAEIKYKFPAKYQNLLTLNGSIDSLRDYGIYIKRVLKKYFTRHWNPKERHLIFHSSGYDSRIISLTLAELRDEGFNLGELHFRCHQPEGEVFKQIMQREGWEKHQYSVFKGPEVDHYDLGNPEVYMNGWQNIKESLNFWSDLGTDWTLVAGFGGEISKFHAFKFSNGKTYHDKINQRKGIKCQNKGLEFLLNSYPGQGEMEAYYQRIFNKVMYPFWSYQYLSIATLINPEYCKEVKDTDEYGNKFRTDNVRKYITTLFKYDLSDIKYVKHDYNWELSIERIAKMVVKYYTSIFYDHWEIDINTDFSKMTGWDCYMYGFMTCYERIYS